MLTDTSDPSWSITIRQGHETIDVSQISIAPFSYVPLQAVSFCCRYLVHLTYA